MFDANNEFAFPKGSFNQKVQPPATPPDEGEMQEVCFSADWLPIVLGALDQLLLPYTWVGDEAEVQDALDDATRLKQMFAVPTCSASDVECPYWDDETDVGDSEPADTQTWYGEVTNPDAPPEELDFVENAIVWGFTGLLALATPELGFAPAIAFHTIAPRFILAQKRGDIATVIQIFLDRVPQAKIDTTGMSEGDIIEVPIVGDDGEHDILIMNTLP